MFSVKLTRRQFLKWLSASAAALGLSQTELLKVKEALAAGPTPDPTNPLGTLLRVIWIAGAACSGCPTSLLNYIADKNDPDLVLNQIANNFPAIPELAGALVDVEALYPVSSPYGYKDPPEGDHNIDIAEVVLEIVTIDYAQVIMAASGDLPNNHMKSMRNSEDAADNYVLLVEGTILTKNNGKFCRIFDLPDNGDVGDSESLWGPYTNFYTDDMDVNRAEFTMAGATLWLASSDRCQAVVALGTCAAYGGVPAAKGHVTEGKSAWEWIVQENEVERIVLNVPGCPPNPDWFIHTVGAAILYLTGLLPAALDVDGSLDHKGRPKQTQIPIYHDGGGYPFCTECPRRDQGYAQKLSEARRTAADPTGKCLIDVGCMGSVTGPANVRADCPSRRWNPIESYSSNATGGKLTLKKNNWCVGNNMPCQGCTDPGFPDNNSPFYSKAKGF